MESNSVLPLHAPLPKSKILLCDEPTGALDYQTGKQILTLLQEMARKQETTVIIVTHNASLAQLPIVSFECTMPRLRVWNLILIHKNRGLGILERSTVMKKTTYWKDAWRTFVASKGRMLSIALLMALGSFALIGLKVTSPNMKNWGTLLQDASNRWLELNQYLQYQPNRSGPSQFD